MIDPINIGNQTIGSNFPCFVIAEAGVNHNGKLDLALELVRTAKQIGANCIKFQTFKAERVVTPGAPKAAYQLEVTDRKESQFEMLKKLELQFEDYRKIIACCNDLGIQFLSTPYNEEDADFLNELGVDAFKIASGQIVETPFLEYVAKLGKPMIVSTGMADLAEAFDGVQSIRNKGNDQIVVLQCTTNYPSKLEDANINAMISMREALNVLVGYSDHVPENYACYAAVSHGATVIEKHFTLDKSMEGPDHSSSLNPKEFEQLIKGIRGIEVSLGNKIKSPTPAEKKNIDGMRRSIVVDQELEAGTVLIREHLAFKRPGTGILPRDLFNVIGKKLSKSISKDTILTQDHF